MQFLHRTGWMKVFRTARERDRRFEEAERWNREFGIRYRAIDAPELREPRAACGAGADRRAALDRPGERRRPARPRARLPRRLRAPGRALRAGQRGEPRSRRRRRAGGRRTLADEEFAGTSFGGHRRGGARPLGRRPHARARLRVPACREARLSHALPGGRHGEAEYADARYRARLLPCADAPRHPAHHRRRVRAARRHPHPGAARARGADRARPLPARRAARHRALDGRAALHARHAAGARARAAPPQPLFRLRPRPPRPHARRGHRAAAGRDDHRRDAVRRPGALFARPVR